MGIGARTGYRKRTTMACEDDIASSSLNEAAQPERPGVYANQSRINASAAGAACTYKIRRLTVAAP